MVYLLLSLSVFLMFAAFVAIEISRSIKRGFMKTLISFSGIIFSIVVGIFVGRFFGGIFGKYAVNLMKKFLFRGAYIGGSMNMENIASMLVQALLSSVLFVVAFLIVRGLFATVVGIICRRKLKSVSDGRVRDDKTKESRREKWMSVIAGAMCGILVTAAISSPVLGAFGLMQSAVSIVDKTEINIWTAFRIKEEQIKQADAYSRNFPSVFVYAMGGQMIYTASATAKLDGKNVSVPLEMSALEDNVDNIIEIVEIFGKNQKPTADDIKVLDSIYELTEDSEIFKHVLAEYIQKGTSSWLRKGNFMSVPSPVISSTFTSLFDEILRICSGTSADTVGNDVKTLVHIYGDILECSDYHSVLDAVTYSDVMMNINNELKHNTRMNNTLVRGELHNIIVVSMAAQMALDRQGTSGLERYGEFLTGVASSANEAIDNSVMTRDQRISDLTEKMNMHCNNMGYQFSQSALTLVSEAIIDEFSNSDSPVTASSIATFFGGTVLEDIV